jgi:hypothetical protein
LRQYETRLRRFLRDEQRTAHRLRGSSVPETNLGLAFRLLRRKLNVPVRFLLRKMA